MKDALQNAELRQRRDVSINLQGIARTCWLLTMVILFGCSYFSEVEVIISASDQSTLSDARKVEELLQREGFRLEQHRQLQNSSAERVNNVSYRSDLHPGIIVGIKIPEHGSGVIIVTIVELMERTFTSRALRLYETIYGGLTDLFGSKRISIRWMSERPRLSL